MNKFNEQTPTIAPVKPGDATTQPSKPAAPSTKDSPDLDRRPDATKSSFTPRAPDASRDTAKPSLQAAGGNDEVMSQQPQKSS